jgi:hypothetical protein
LPDDGRTIELKKRVKESEAMDRHDFVQIVMTIR